MQLFYTLPMPLVVTIVDWLSVPPVTVPVQESVPSSPSARGERGRVPVMAGVTEYLSGGMWSRPLQWVDTASSLFTLESSVTVEEGESEMRTVSVSII